MVFEFFLALERLGGEGGKNKIEASFFFSGGGHERLFGVRSVLDDIFVQHHGSKSDDSLTEKGAPKQRVVTCCNTFISMLNISIPLQNHENGIITKTHFHIPRSEKCFLFVFLDCSSTSTTLHILQPNSSHSQDCKKGGARTVSFESCLFRQT